MLVLFLQVGIGLVGMSSIFSGEGSSTHVVSTEQMLMGMGLIVASQVRGAGKLVSRASFYLTAVARPDDCRYQAQGLTKLDPKIVTSCLHSEPLQAAQLTFEEFFTADLSMDPMQPDFVSHPS